ncbi:MAG: acyl-CoA dehydratase activase, partial [Oscillospiraceae bacterium]
MSLSVGIDIGSTTVKIVVMNENDIIFRAYERHFSQVRQKTAELLRTAKDIIGNNEFTLSISGSAGLGVAKAAELTFIQEVFATGEAIRMSKENIDIVIELGGEDAKILFLTGGLEERMNGTCAGGTGAFIDQMASLLNVTAQELDDLSFKAQRIYPIASRCGVFAKSDIQPLLNQGASKADLAASIFKAVVEQTITELAQGRQLKGKIAFLGGPLFFFKGLQKSFVQTLNLSPENALFPSWAQFSVAIGAAVYAKENSAPTSFDALIKLIDSTALKIHSSHYLPPLFDNNDEYLEFLARHANATIQKCPIEGYSGHAYLGIDCGSTTTKLVLINENDEILYEYYSSNRGNPVDII